MSNKTNELKAMYDFCRQMPKEAFREGAVELVPFLKVIYSDKADENTAKGFLAIAKVAQKVSEKEFLNFMKTQEMPPVKLSKNEMEAMKGGWAFLAAGAVGLGFWGYKSYKTPFTPPTEGNRVSYGQFLLHPIQSMKWEWNNQSRGAVQDPNRVRPWGGGAIDDAQRINDQASGKKR